MLKPTRLLLCLSLVLPALAPARAAAQFGDGAPAVVSLPVIASPSEDRLRVDQLLGRAPTDGYLLRSTATLLPALPEDSTPRLRVQFLLPHLHTVWNSDLPFSQNDGALFAARGLSTQLVGGVRARFGFVTVVFAPEVRYEQNEPFPFIPHPNADRSPFAARWHWDTLPISIDMPTRFGDEYRAALGPGQSSLTAELGPVAFGLARDDQWWGPGIRNAIVLSNNGPAVPRAFLRTARPVATPIGAFEAEWVTGSVQESVHFDTINNNGKRHLSGLVLTYSPAIEPNLTIGATRTVMGRISGVDDIPTRMFTPITRKERKEEQLAALFARWVFPAAGFEAYGEWARHQLTTSLRQFLITPNHTQGYTVGAQWARPLTADSGSVFRVQSELTYLEQSPTTRHRPNDSFYTSNLMPQGYTNRGQVLGAAIGPGSSSQWLAADYLARDWQLGLFAGRIRWDNDAYYLTQEPTNLDHDVSIFAGLRGGARIPGARVDLELTQARRYNFMFQNDIRVLGGGGTWDVDNTTLRLTVSATP